MRKVKRCGIHLYYFDRSTIKNLLEEQGLKVISISTRLSLLRFWLRIFPIFGLNDIIPMVARIIYQLPDMGIGSDIVVIAKK